MCEYPFSNLHKQLYQVSLFFSQSLLLFLSLTLSIVRQTCNDK